jgi:hypothetical protein
MKDRAVWVILAVAFALGFGYVGLLWLMLVAPYAGR